MTERDKCASTVYSVCVCVCVCVCFLPILSGHQVRWTYQPVTQEEGHTGFFIHLLSAVRALIFLATRIRPLLSLVDREVEFCVTNDLIVLYSKKNPVYRDRTHVPTCQKVARLPLSYQGDRLILYNSIKPLLPGIMKKWRREVKEVPHDQA